MQPTIITQPARVTAARGSRPRFLLLVADPDPDIGQALLDQLGAYQIDVVTCGDGADALLQAGILLPDAMLVAASIETLTSPAIVRALQRHTGIPAVVGVGDRDSAEAGPALAAGATACIARPYRMAELLPILRAIRPDTAADIGAPLIAGALRLDPATVQVFVHGRPVRLPLREFHLLHLLMSHADRVVTRQQIIALLWNGDEGSNTVNVHIRRLRNHIGDDVHNPHIILTIRGMGYRLVPPPERDRSR